MNAQFKSIIQHGTEITIPLNKLKTSPRNARRTPHTVADIETLAASITAKGVLQPPVVQPEHKDGEATGAYFVTIGEGRRRALTLLAKRKQISKDAPIRCLLDLDNDAFEVSLDENVTRFNMHPADQFEAFRELSEQRGWTAEEIGARFGVSASLVRQRMRLGAISPVLMAAYRADDLTLDQLMAFALCDDHGRQTQVFDNLTYNRSPSYIRRMMTEHEVEASDRRAIFVGAQAYEREGGSIRRDLFAEDGGGWFEDVEVLDPLTLDKLAAEAETLRTAEGWRWTEALLDYPHAHGFRRVYPVTTEHDPETQARLSALAEVYDDLVGDADADALEPETSARLREIDAQLQAAERPIYAPDVYDRAGAFLVLNWDGTVRVERGFMRPEDERHTAEGPLDQSPSGDGHQLGLSPQPGDETRPKPLPDRLIADLTAHRTAALQESLANQPQIAMLAAVHALTLQAFYHSGSDSCLKLRAQKADLARYTESYPESIAGRAIQTRHELWHARFPEDPAKLWLALLDLPFDEQLKLFAHCVALAVDAVQVVSGPRPASNHADQLATLLNLDIGDFWQVSADGYFAHLTKAQILETVGEIKPEASARLGRMNKEEMVTFAVDLLRPQGWLPPLMKAAAVPSA